MTEQAPLARARADEGACGALDLRDLAALRACVQRTLAGHDVLELACGTGDWTQVYANSARSVLAVDPAEEALELARAKEYPFGKVRFGKADVNHLEDIPGTFTAGLAGSWRSRIARERIPEFLEAWHRRLGPGAWAVILDDHQDEGNDRPTSREFLAAVQDRAQDLELVEFQHAWCLYYRVGSEPRES